MFPLKHFKIGTLSPSNISRNHLVTIKFYSDKNYEVKFTKITISRKIQNIYSNYNKTCEQQKKLFYDVATKQTKHKQTIISRQFFGYFTFEKNISYQVRTRGLCRPRRIRFLQTKRTEDANKFELIMNQHTKDSVKQDYPKSL